MAHETVDAVFTAPIVAARVWSALIEVNVTVCTRVPRGTVTCVRVHSIRATTTVLTWV